jgi:hypothetical protein
MIRIQPHAVARERSICRPHAAGQPTVPPAGGVAAPAHASDRLPALRWLRAAVVAAALGTTTLVFARTTLDVPIIVTQVPTRSAPARNATGAAPGRSLVRSESFDGAQLVVVSPEGQVRVLSTGFESACDPNVSFDGQRVLFAGRRAADARWRIWEIGLDGTGLRAITPETLDARHPIYVSTLFTLDSPQPWQTLLFVGQEPAPANPGSATSNLYSIKLAGGELRRLTYHPGDSLDPFQMWDGRVLYATERFVQEGPAGTGRVSLFAIHIEGADVELYGGELGRRVQQMPCATEGGLVVFVESDTPTVDGAGRIGWVSQRRPHLTHEAKNNGDAHSYRYPYPLQKNEVLVAQRPAASGSRWGIVRFDAETGATSPVFASDGYDAVQAVPVRVRRAPDGHSTVVTSNDNYGTLYGLDCYTTDAARSGKLQPGDVKRVRLIEGLVTGSPAGRPDATPRRLIGEAAVATDGSFNLFVPSDTPLQLQTLDANGMALGTCGWFWVKPQEKRGCIGCHEDPERVPENRFVLALHHDSVPLLPPVAERRTVIFTRDVAPILQRIAVTGLVDARQQPLRLAFDTPQALQGAYQALTAGPAPLVEPGRARTSRLVWQLLGRNTSRPWDSTAQARVPSTPARIAGDDLNTLILWIDLGAAYDAPATTAKEIAAK